MIIPLKEIFKVVRNNTVGEFYNGIEICVMTFPEPKTIYIIIDPWFENDESEECRAEWFNKVVSGLEDIEFDTDMDEILGDDDDIVIRIDDSRVLPKHLNYLDNCVHFEKCECRNFIVYKAGFDIVNETCSEVFNMIKGCVDNA